MEMIKTRLYGAMLGDMIGAPYEFFGNPKRKDMNLFDEEKWIRLTDDSYMTLAVAKALISVKKPLFNFQGDALEKKTKKALITCMQDIGNRYDASYGTAFKYWLHQDDPQPYRSYGNGSAMRVSAVGWLYYTIEETRKVAKWTAEISHDHPEGIKGAEAIASVIYLSRIGKSKEEILRYILDNFDYDLSKTVDKIRPTYQYNDICQATVPEAIICFLESVDFEDAIRNAMSLGGDADTLTCITGSMAEAFYNGVPLYMKEECDKRLEHELKEIVENFNKFLEKREK